MNKIIIEKAWAPPNRHTFNIKPIFKLLKKEITPGIWLDPYANEARLATITNDLNINFDTDYHLEALDFLRIFDTETIDGILYDPPYSLTQTKRIYDGIGLTLMHKLSKSNHYSKLKREIQRIVKPNGKVISFGWNSGGVGRKYGFETQYILLIAHGGSHNDTIAVVDKRIKEQKEMF